MTVQKPNKSLTKVIKAYNRCSEKFITTEKLVEKTGYTEARINKIVSLHPGMFRRVVNVNKSVGKVLNSFTYQSGYATVNHIVRKTQYSPERIEKVLELNPQFFAKSLIKKGGEEQFYLLRSEVGLIQDVLNTIANVFTERY
jgi:hypothetical protein